MFPAAPTQFVPLSVGVSKDLKLEEQWEGRWERYAGAGWSEPLKPRSKPWDCEDGGDDAGEFYTWKQHTWLDFLFKEVILTSESGTQVDQRKAGRSEMFLAQEEIFFQLRQQTGNYSSLQEHKCPSQHWTEECADLVEGT